MVNRRSLIEGGVLLACGLIGVADGLRLIVFKNPASVEDFTGPGRYLFVVSVILAIAGAVYLVVGGGEAAAKPAAAPESSNVNRSVVAIVVVLGLYVTLIDLVGYLWSTLAFFPVILLVAGLRWSIRTLLIGLTMAIGFYLVFVRLFGMSFPHGKLFS